MPGLRERLERLSPERRHYTLETLARHLVAAGHVDRLRRLFDDDEWMQARFEASGYTYTGFRDDLRAAWDEHAQPEALRQLEVASEPHALADCFLYALIHTSPNSVASNYTPELVARAVQTGLWASARGLAVSASVPEDDGRARMYIALLDTGALHGDERRAAQDGGLEAANAFHSKWDKIPLFVQLARHLDGEVALRALDAAMVLEDDDGRVATLVALASKLDGAARQRALDRALETAYAASSQEGLPRMVASIAPLLAGEGKTAALARALEATRAIKGSSAADVFEDLAPHLEGALAAQGHEIALAMNGAHRAEALAAIAPSLPGELRERALAGARAIQVPGLRARALAALAPRLEDEKKEQAQGEALNAALAEDKSRRFDALVEIAPRLTDAHRADALARALKLASGDRGAYWRVRSLTELAPLLGAEQRSFAIDDAFDSMKRIREKFYLAPACAVLAPFLEGERKAQTLDAWLESAAGRDEASVAEGLEELRAALTPEFAARALDAVLALRDEKLRARAMAALVPSLDAPSVSRALAAALDVGDDEGCAVAVVALARHLAPDLREPLLDWAVTVTLAIRNPHTCAQTVARLVHALDGERRARVLARGIEATASIERESDRIFVLKSLAPLVDGHLLAPTLKLALGIRYAPWFVDAMVPLIPKLDRRRREQALELALAAARRGEYEELRAGALEDLSPYLEGTFLNEAEQLAESLREPAARAQALTAVAPRRGARRRMALLDAALDAVSRIAKPDERARQLGRLAPHLRGRLAARGIEVAQALDDGEVRAKILLAFATNQTGRTRTHARALARESVMALAAPEPHHEGSPAVRALTALIPHLANEERERAIARALAMAQAMSTEWHRATVMLSVLPFDERRAIPEIRRGLASELRELRDKPRAWVVNLHTAYTAMFAPPVLPPPVIGAIAKHIVDVRERWRWA